MALRVLGYFNQVADGVNHTTHRPVIRLLNGVTEALEAKGLDQIACVSVNDAFVMDAWGKSHDVGDKILMLADGNGEYSKALGLELDATGFGMGTRGQRFAIVVKDGVAKDVEIEAPKEFKVSAAEYILGKL